MLLDRADGSRVLLLWRQVSLWDQEIREATPQRARTVDLHFGGEPAFVEVTYPSRDADPLKPEAGDRVPVAVGGDVVAVSFR